MVEVLGGCASSIIIPQVLDKASFGRHLSREFMEGSTDGVQRPPIIAELCTCCLDEL